MTSKDLKSVTSVSIDEKEPFWKYVLKNKLLYIMLIPGLIQLILFRYGPMFFLVVAFKNYNPFLGVLQSSWVGLAHFERFFSGGEFWGLFRNTLYLASLNLVFLFPAPIIISLLLNEVRFNPFKRLTQTIIYIPHFISWPIVASMTYVMFTIEGGIVNDLIVMLGGEKIPFLMSERTFHGVYIGQILWRETGYATILYLAAIAGVDISQYESAIIDGANRFHRLWHITLPGIKSTIITLFILRLGYFMETGFEQIYLLKNPLNRVYSEVIDTYVYEYGILRGMYSYTTAIGIFTSVIGLVLVLAANRAVKKMGQDGIL